MQRRYEVPLPIQQALAWQRDRDEALRWRRDYEIARRWEDDARRSAVDQHSMRLASDGELRRAAHQAADFRQSVADSQPPVWMQTDRPGIAAATNSFLATQELSRWIASQEEMRKQFESIEELSRSTSLMHNELRSLARAEP